MRGRSLLAGLVVAAFVAACGGSAPSPNATSGNKPSVLVQAPTNGAVVPVGSNVDATGAASDTVGVDHVALFVDGVSVASSPSGQPTPLLPFSLTWLATPAGPHVLQVVAYRADGTTSDPAVINLVVGAGGSFPSGSGGPPPFSFVPASQPGLITPPPSKKPKPTKAPVQSTAPTTQPTSATSAPTGTPTPSPTPTPTPLPTPNSDGTAPVDTEPHIIVLDPLNAAGCPADSTGIPMAAIGCVWEQLSAPAGDSTDELDYAFVPNASYKIQMTSCSDASDLTVWLTPSQDPSLVTGCTDWLVLNTGPTASGMQMIVVTFSAAPSQLYNLYQYTVYQCQFANCATQ